MFSSSLRAVRAKVWQRRNQSPLFNCKTYANDMERLYERMWQRFASGEKPFHITEWEDEQ